MTDALLWILLSAARQVEQAEAARATLSQAGDMPAVWEGLAAWAELETAALAWATWGLSHESESHG